METDHQPLETGTPRFDTRLVVILRDDLATWQKLNATLFLVSGIAASDPTTVGEPYEDASGARYLPVFRQPGLVFAATGEEPQRPSSEPGNAMSSPRSSSTSCSRPRTTRTTGPRYGQSERKISRWSGSPSEPSAGSPTR